MGGGSLIMATIQLTNTKVINHSVKNEDKNRIIYGKLHEDLKKRYCNGMYDAEITDTEIKIKKRL